MLLHCRSTVGIALYTDDSGCAIRRHLQVWTAINRFVHRARPQTEPVML